MTIIKIIVGIIAIMIFNTLKTMLYDTVITRGDCATILADISTIIFTRKYII